MAKTPTTPPGHVGPEKYAGAHGGYEPGGSVPRELGERDASEMAYINKGYSLDMAIRLAAGEH